MLKMELKKKKQLENNVKLQWEKDSACLLWNLKNLSNDLWKLAEKNLLIEDRIKRRRINRGKHVAAENRQLYHKGALLPVIKVYGFKFEHKCLRGIVCFVESYLKTPTLLSEVIYERTGKEHSKKRTSSNSGISNKLSLSVLLILWNLNDKSETVS